MGQRCLAEPGVGSLLPVDVEMWRALPLATRGSWYCGYLCVTLAEPCDTPGLSSRRKAVHGDSRGVLSVLAERSASLCNAPFPTAGRGGEALCRASRPWGCGSSTPGPGGWCIRQPCSGACSQASEAGQPALGLPAWEFLARGGMTRTPVSDIGRVCQHLGKALEPSAWREFWGMPLAFVSCTSKQI